MPTSETWCIFFLDQTPRLERSPIWVDESRESSFEFILTTVKLPADGALGVFFTATSMIGFMAGAGIVVPNSIILVDFSELRLREGMPLDRAVIDAGAVRFRPMLLTAAAVVVGSSAILFDPVFLVRRRSANV